MENKSLEQISEKLKNRKLKDQNPRLATFSWKTIAKQIIWGVIILVIAIYIIRIATWENSYYKSKEGSKRAPSAYVATPETVDETEPTENEIAEYTVPASHPRYLIIDKLGLHHSRVIQVGVKSNNQLGTPTNIFDVGWYNASATPGSGGTIVMDGHNGGPTKIGVFKYLPVLEEGDIIKIERGDGKIFSYSVVENVAIDLSSANDYMTEALVSPTPGVESLTLITCSGDWSSSASTYLSRQFVRATLIQ